MKRIDITSSTYNNIIDELSIRPSVKEQIRHQLYRNDLSHVRDLCLKTEEELLSVPYFTQDLVESIKAYLMSAGLHLGMTEDVLTDYMDADFLENRGKEKPDKDSKDSYVLVRKDEWEALKAEYSGDNNEAKENVRKEHRFPLVEILLGIMVAAVLYIIVPIALNLFGIRNPFDGKSCDGSDNRPKTEKNYSDFSHDVDNMYLPVDYHKDSWH